MDHQYHSIPSPDEILHQFRRAQQVGQGWIATEEARHLAEQARYALAKQLDTAHSLESDYGPLELDDELRQAVIAALTPILEHRAKAGEGAR